MQSVVDTKLMQDIVNDFRTYSPTPKADPSAKVVPQGAGRVVTAGDAVAHGGSGWVDAPKVDSWKAPGIDLIDGMVAAQDERDRLARIREAAEAAALRKAEAEFLKNKQHKEKGPK
jgi:hypothetical protein